MKRAKQQQAVHRSHFLLRHYSVYVREHAGVRERVYGAEASHLAGTSGYFGSIPKENETTPVAERARRGKKIANVNLLNDENVRSKMQKYNTLALIQERR